MITFKNLLLKLRESSNSASVQGLGISGSEGKAPGSVSAKIIATPKVTTTTQVKPSNTKSKEEHDTEDMWYVKDNKKFTKTLAKETSDRVKNHHK
jgi:hypothetical protein